MSAATGKVVIVGAGAVGSTFAYALQIHGAAREIVLIDMDKERAEGEALDLSHGVFFTPPVDIRAGDYEDCAGADVVAICAGAKQKPGQSRMDLVGTNIDICKAMVERVVEQTSEAILQRRSRPNDMSELKRSRADSTEVVRRRHKGSAATGWSAITVDRDVPWHR